jgi:hypothetical protein
LRESLPGFDRGGLEVSAGVPQTRGATSKSKITLNNLAPDHRAAGK